MPVAALFFAVGYEARSRFIASELRGGYDKGFAFRFGSQEGGAFTENLRWCAAEPTVSIAIAENEGRARDVALEWFRGLNRADGQPIRIAVDISSMSRMLMAVLVATAVTCARELGEIDIMFLYAPARFAPPGGEHGPVVKFGAVLPEFSGLSEAGQALATVIGLGYEPDLALASQQGLDPAESWLAVPTGIDSRFNEAVRMANAGVIALSDPNRIVEFEVLRPFDTFMKVESIVSGLSRSHNVVIVPFGPKIFALVGLLVAVEHDRRIGVWRVTAGRLGRSQDVEADGRIAAIRAVFRGMRSE
jgi:hypothetical protein